MSSNKFLNTFFPQPLKMDSLITNGEETTRVGCTMETGQHNFGIRNGTLDWVHSPDKPFEILTTFIPTKEIFSVFEAIVETREGPKELSAFDDTYYDLVKDFRLPTAKEEPEKSLPSYFEPLTKGGRVEYTDGQLWWNRKGIGKECIRLQKAFVKSVFLID